MPELPEVVYNLAKPDNWLPSSDLLYPTLLTIKIIV